MNSLAFSKKQKVACFHVEVSILGSEGHAATDLFPSNLGASFTCSFAQKWKEKKKDLNAISINGPQQADSKCVGRRWS